MTIRPRFKEYQSGAAHPLHHGDLLLARLSPIAQGVHDAKMLVYESGHFEFVEYIAAGKRRNSVFHKENGQFDESCVAHIRETLRDLQAVNERIPDLDTLGPEFDPFEYEGPDRRGVAYWSKDVEVGAGIFPDRFYAAFGVSELDKALFTERFNHLWTVLLSALDCPHFRPRKGKKWISFPLEGDYEGPAQPCDGANPP